MGAPRTGTQYVSPDLLGLDQVLGMRIRDVALEVGVADHIGEVRASFGVTEERFREEEDELEKVLASVTMTGWSLKRHLLACGSHGGSGDAAHGTNGGER